MYKLSHIHNLISNKDLSVYQNISVLIDDFYLTIIGLIMLAGYNNIE